MKTAIIKTIGWTKFLAALMFLSSIFGFSVNAQDNPLNAQQLAKLTAGLKDTLRETLAVAETDGKKYAAVTQKWDAHRDLAEKSTTQVINMLFQDVKIVITDSGMQYQIYQAFSLYKHLPDEQLTDQTKSRMGFSNSKPEAVEQLTNLTMTEHPYVGIEAELAKLPGTKDIEAAKAQDRKNRIEGFEAALKTNNKLTADQKAFVRANYDQLIKITDKITADAINKNFPTEQWIMEGLDQSYTAKFALKELNEIITFLDTENENPILRYIRQTNMAQLITGNGGKLTYTAADKAEYDKFVATPLGKKFIAAYLTETIAYEQRKENAARAIPNSDGFAIYEPANLNRLFNKFVAENYKK